MMEFNMKVEFQRQKIAEKSAAVNNEVRQLLFMRLASILGYSLKETEKTLAERILEAISFYWVTAKQVCFIICPLKDISDDERRQALKRIRTQLYRLSGREKKKKPGRPKAKLVLSIETKPEILYLISWEGIKRLHFYREKRISLGNSKALNEKMQAVNKLTEELISEIDQMQTCNIEVLKNLTPLPMPKYLHLVQGAKVSMLAHRIVEDRKEVLENQNNWRVESFVKGVKELLLLGETEIQISYSLHQARELQKLLSDQSR